MYIPKQFQISDRQKAIHFMQRYSFGTIVTAADSYPQATHLPFLIEERDGELFISSHFAKANPQAVAMDQYDILVIFTEPHAYISPKYYEKEMNVPTWNYMAVHAYGKARLLTTEQQHHELLARTINTFEPAYFKQWQSLSEDYRSKMIKGITGFEMLVTDLQGKEKLSQNKLERERQYIIESFSKSDDANEKTIAEYMLKNEAPNSL
jgi:transcriptional regulator